MTEMRPPSGRAAPAAAGPCWMVAAAHKSSGKTTLSIGLAAALTKRGLTVQTFKKGPDYIDPMWLSRASGRPCINLDPYLMSEAEIRIAFAARRAGTDIAFIEANKGLYDGLALDGSNCNAALAKQLGLPVVLVLDARGMTRGIAPLILGYQAFDRELCFAGVILNQLGGSRHEAKLRSVIEHYTDLEVLGALQHDPALALSERHLGLTPDAELGDAAARIAALGEAVSTQVDLDRLLDCSVRPTPATPPTLRWPRAPATGAAAQALRPVRLGIARDAAFGFYYPDDLAALEAAGAELVPFDTLNDHALPADLDGLFIGGGFPEMFLDRLHANGALRTEVRQAIEGGLPSYAECGGLMYLARSISWQGRRIEMAGVIPGDVLMHERPVGRGYVHLAETADFPWPALPPQESGSATPERRAHEFHHSSLEGLPADSRFAYQVLRGHGITGRQDGLCLHRLMASYTHLRHVGENHWPARFVAYIRDCRRLDAPSRSAALASQGKDAPRIDPALQPDQEPLPCSA